MAQPLVERVVRSVLRAPLREVGLPGDRPDDALQLVEGVTPQATALDEAVERDQLGAELRGDRLVGARREEQRAVGRPGACVERAQRSEAQPVELEARQLARPEVFAAPLAARLEA